MVRFCELELELELRVTLDMVEFPCSGLIT